MAIVIVVLVVIILIVMAAVCVLYLKSVSGTRPQEIQQIASQLGFTYVGKGDGSYTRGLSKIRLFQIGDTPVEQLVIKKTQGDDQILVVDVAWHDLAPGGKGISKDPKYVETLVCFDCQGMKLPDFACCIGGRLARSGIDTENLIGSKFPGYQKIETEVMSDFSRKYLFYGKNKETTSKFFERSGLAASKLLENDINFEGNGNVLIVYKEHHVLTVAEAPAFVDNAKKVMERLQKASLMGSAA